MLIEDYFQQIRQTIDACHALQSSAVTYDKRGTHEGYIRGELRFEDGSILQLREFVDVETIVERLMYVYQYMDASEHLVFRYDNTGHHKGLPTYPHHKHQGDANDVVASPAPELRVVLNEIEGLVQLP